MLVSIYSRVAQIPFPSKVTLTFSKESPRTIHTRYVLFNRFLRTIISFCCHNSDHPSTIKLQLALQDFLLLKDQIKRIERLDAAHQLAGRRSPTAVMSTIALYIHSVIHHPVFDVPFSYYVNYFYDRCRSATGNWTAKSLSEDEGRQLLEDFRECILSFLETLLVECCFRDCSEIVSQLYPDLYALPVAPIPTSAPAAASTGLKVDTAITTVPSMAPATVDGIPSALPTSGSRRLSVSGTSPRGQRLSSIKLDNLAEPVRARLEQLESQRQSMRMNRRSVHGPSTMSMRLQSPQVAGDKRGESGDQPTSVFASSVDAFRGSLDDILATPSGSVDSSALPFGLLTVKPRNNSTALMNQEDRDSFADTLGPLPVLQATSSGKKLRAPQFEPVVPMEQIDEYEAPFADDDNLASSPSNGSSAVKGRARGASDGVASFRPPVLSSRGGRSSRRSSGQQELPPPAPLVPMPAPAVVATTVTQGTDAVEPVMGLGGSELTGDLAVGRESQVAAPTDASSAAAASGTNSAASAAGSTVCLHMFYDDDILDFVRAAVRKQLEIELYIPCVTALRGVLNLTFKAKDLDLTLKCDEIRHQSQEYFTIPKPFWSPSNYDDVVNLTKTLRNYILPVDKLNLLVEVYRLIPIVYNAEREAEGRDDEAGQRRSSRRGAKGHSKALGTEDLLPIFIYALVRANIPNLYALKEELMALIDPSKNAGEHGFMVASLESAVEYICSCDVTERNLMPIWCHVDGNFSDDDEDEDEENDDDDD